MTLTLLFCCLALAAMLPLVLPMLRRARPAPDRRHFCRAVYRDQLRELDHAAAHGFVPETDAAAARLEIQRRLLAAAAAAPLREGRAGRSPVLASVVVLFVLGGAAGLYAWLGAPGTSNVVFVSRPAVSGETTVAASVPAYSDLAREAVRLADKLKTDPSDAEHWVLFAKASGSLRHWDAAVGAYRHALALDPAGPGVEAGLGEMLVMQADGIVTPAARDAFAAALKDDPKNNVARYYLALAAGQAGWPAETIKALQELAADMPEDAPMRDDIAKRIEEAAKAAGQPVPELAKGKPAAEPDADAMDAAALPEGDQTAMIAAMAAKLATRLESEPGDADGWMRLGQAYAVMGEPGKAAEAYDRAAILKPGDAAIRLQAVGGLLTGLKPDEALPPRAIALLKQVERIAPDDPEVLWYLGVAAARDAHPNEAKRYWSRLLLKLPAESENTRMVKAALNSL